MDKHNSRPKILIVDDDKFILDMYAIKFGEKGFKVETSLSGNEALDRLEAGLKPDIVLLDLVMPGVDGFEVLSKIKKNKLTRDYLVVILSNLGAKEDVDRVFDLGADGYIVKASSTPSEVVIKTMEIWNKKK